VHVYSLTALTGRRKNENRRMVVATVELRRVVVIVAGLSVLASAPVALVLSPMLGPWALTVPVIGAVIGLWLFDARQGRGLRLKNYQAIVDHRRSRNGVLYASGAPIPHPRLVMHQPVVLPAVELPSPVVATGRATASARPSREEMFG